MDKKNRNRNNGEPWSRKFGEDENLKSPKHPVKSLRAKQNRNQRLWKRQVPALYPQWSKRLLKQSKNPQQQTERTIIPTPSKQAITFIGLL